MKDKIIESIPNISEGRNKEVIEKIVDQVRDTKGCILMNYSSDKDHNRTVITYMGSPDAVYEASIKIVEKAVELIDLRNHKGEHPRMGVVDVMPLVPIKNADMKDCIELSLKIGKEVAEKHGMPVFLYEESAKNNQRKRLEVIRKGQFEGLDDKLKEPQWKPDFGDRKKHQSGGALILGARKPLIAYNVLLNTSDVEIAKKISKAIRESSGGLKNVKALGIYLENRKLAQVSMNLTDYKTTSVFEVVEKIKDECKKYKVDIKSTELIGMMPMRAYIETAAKYLQIEDFQYDKQVIENFLI